MLPRLPVLGVAGPFFHITGLVVRATSAGLLIAFTLVGYLIMLIVLVTQALDGSEHDTLYWLVPGAAHSCNHA